MIVLTNDPFFAGDVEASQYLQKVVSIFIDRFCFWNNRLGRRRSINRFAYDRRPTIVQELHAQIADRLAVVLQFESTGRNKLPNDCCLDIFCSAQRVEFFPLVFGNRKDHTFLSLGNPNLGVRKAFVFKRGFFQPNLRSDLFAHLADSTGKPSRSAIRYGVEQSLVARGEQYIHHHFFRNGVADLNSSTRKCFAFAGEFGRTERCSVDAIASRSTTDCDNVIARLSFFKRLVARNDSNVAAINKRISQITIVKIDRSVDGRNPHAVTVVSNAGHNSLHHFLGVKDSGW